MALDDELQEIAAAAERFADRDEDVAAILVAEAVPGDRLYLCAYDAPSGRSWLALDAQGGPVTDRNRVRQAASIAAMCEVAEEQAGGGDLDELRRDLASLRDAEDPPGIEEADAAAVELERTLAGPPRVASPTYLDELGVATRRLEAALGNASGSPFAAAMLQNAPAVEQLATEIEAEYKLPLT